METKSTHVSATAVAIAFALTLAFVGLFVSRSSLPTESGALPAVHDLAAPARCPQAGSPLVLGYAPAELIIAAPRGALDPMIDELSVVEVDVIVEAQGERSAPRGSGPSTDNGSGAATQRELEHTLVTLDCSVDTVSAVSSLQQRAEALGIEAVISKNSIVRHQPNNGIVPTGTADKSDAEDALLAQVHSNTSGIVALLDAYIDPSPWAMDTVVVGIFDSSPVNAGTHAIDTWKDFDFEVNAAPGTLPNVPSGFSDPEPREHGLFVAGVLRNYAADLGTDSVNIELTRVLNDAGMGYVSTLQSALSDFASAHDLEDAVIVLPFTIGSASAPLEAQLSSYDAAGAHILASSGNAVPSESQQDPAAYSAVIGVGAANATASRACFSNSADIYVPVQRDMVDLAYVGDTWIVDHTLVPPSPTALAACAMTSSELAVIHHRGNGNSSCEAHIPAKLCCLENEDDGDVLCLDVPIGTVTTDLFENGHGYWLGTSFSAAAAAGVAVRIILGH